MASTTGQSLFALMWQPLPSGTMFDAASERLLVSSGADGYISVWNVHAEVKAKSVTTFDTANTQVAALSFTSDGAFLAGATPTRVQIWRADDVTVPLAWWDRNYSGAPYSPSSPDKDTDLQQLKWNCDGQKLAFANGTEVSLTVNHVGNGG